LSDDKQRVYTEYEVVPSQVILERQPRSSQEPRLLPILVRVWGGEIVLNGVRVVMSNSSMMPLPLNQPLLLFLVFDRSAGQYEIYHQRSWVLTIAANGTLHPLMKHSRAFEDGVLAMSYGRIVEAINASQKRK
jgi:hypothetical protein